MQTSQIAGLCDLPDNEEWRLVKALHKSSQADDCNWVSIEALRAVICSEIILEEVENDG